MRITIDIDDELLAWVMKETGESTPSAAINAALREFLRIKEESRKYLGKPSHKRKES